MTKSYLFCTFLAMLLLLLILPISLSGQKNKIPRPLKDKSKTKSRPGWIKIKEDVKLNKNQVLDLLNEDKSENDKTKFKLKKSKKNKKDRTKHIYQQTYKNIPIEYHDWVLHEYENRIYLAQGKSFQLPKDKNPEPTINKDLARDIAFEQMEAKQYAWENPLLEDQLKMVKNDPTATYYPTGDLVWVTQKNQSQIQLTYKFEVYSIDPIDKKIFYISARNGDLIRTIELLRTGCFDHDHTHDSHHHTSASSFNEEGIPGTGTANYITANNGEVSIETEAFDGQFRLKATNLNGSQTIHTVDANNLFSNSDTSDILDADNIWTDDSIAVGAHWGATQTYNYFYDIHDRASYDDAGAVVLNLVHYGNNLPNAFWDGTRLLLGDGDGTNFRAFTSLDLIAHEFTHGVTENNGGDGLFYQDESGALNESFSDIFGAVIEFLYHPDGGDWWIGEDFDIKNNQGIRSMANPNLKNHPDTYLGRNWFDGAGDFGGVHVNSGVQNHWFYLLSEGGTGESDFDYIYDITPIGMDTAAEIAYYNLTNFMTNDVTYYEAMEGSIEAVHALYDTMTTDGAIILSTVREAWCAVGLGNGCGPGFEITHPQALDTISSGTTYEIKWNSDLVFPSAKVKIEYKTDTTDNPFWKIINDNIDNSGSYFWDVPSDYTETGKIKITFDGDPVKIRVSNQDISDTSFTFAIVPCLSLNSFDAPDIYKKDSLVTFTGNITGDTYQWSIDGMEVGTDKDLSYTFTEADIYDISYKVTSPTANCFNEETARHYVLNNNSSGFNIKIANSSTFRAYAQDIYACSDGGYIYSTIFPAAVIKLDALGNKVWSTEKLPELISGNYRMVVHEKEDGNILAVIGVSESAGDVADDQVLLVDIDGSSGAIINSANKRFGISTGRMIPQQIIETDTSFIIGGAYSNTPQQDVFLAEVDKTDFSLLNQRWFGDSDKKDYYGELLPTSDGGFLLGWIQAGSFPEHYVLLKVDENFQEEWKEGLYSFNARPNSGSRLRLVELPNCEGFLMLASANERANSALVKINPIGNVLWAKNYSVPTTGDAILIAFQDMVWDGNNGVTLFGTNGVTFDSNFKPITVDYQILNVGFDGTMNWKRKFTDLNAILPTSASYNLYTAKIKKAQDGGYVMTLPSGDGGETHFVKSDSMGIDGCSITNTTIQDQDITSSFSIENSIIYTIESPPSIQNSADYSFSNQIPAIAIENPICGIVGNDLIAAFHLKESSISVNTTPTIIDLSRNSTSEVWKIDGVVASLPFPDFTTPGVYTITLEASDGILTTTTTQQLTVVNDQECQIPCDYVITHAYPIAGSCPDVVDAQLYTNVTSANARIPIYQLYDSNDSLLAEQPRGHFIDLVPGTYQVKIRTENDVSCVLEIDSITVAPNIDTKAPNVLCVTETIDAAFVHAEVGIPHNHLNYIQEIAGGIGNDWHQLTYEAVDPTELFSDSYHYIHLEGSDNNAEEMETFITANQQLIEDWVAAGNALFINAGPTEGGDMNLGFGGVLLSRVTQTDASTSFPDHPIFDPFQLPNGTFVDIATSYTATAAVSLAALSNLDPNITTPLLTSDGGFVLLAETTWGAGTVYFGGLHLTGFFTNPTNGVNLKKNIHRYLKGLPSPTQNSPFPIELDANRSYTMTLAEMDLGSTDNCGLQSLELNQTTFSCSDVGLFDVVLTGVDEANNVSTCTTKVEIVDPIAITEITDTICMGTFVTFNGIDYTTTGIVRDTFTDIFGCDSIRILDLVVLDTFQTIIDTTICEGESYMFNSVEFESTGIYRDTFTASNGCDSFLVLDLTVLDTSITNLVESICEGEAFPFDNQNITTAGIYRDTLPNVNQCDSIIILDLTVLDTAHTNLIQTICEGDTLAFKNLALTATGIYKDTLKNANQCDSIIILDLTVLDTALTNFIETICEGDTYSFKNLELTATGIYSDTLKNANQCDSIIFLDLTVLDTTHTILDKSICEGEAFPFDNQNITAAGIYRDTLPNVNQCDSIIVLNLMVQDTTVTNLVESICEGEAYLFDNQSLTEAGVYQAVFKNTAGCDSTVNLILQTEDCGSCPEEHIEVNGSPVPKGTYTAIKTITSNSQIAIDTVTFLAGECITLGPGFEAQAGTNFLGEIAPFICDAPTASVSDSVPPPTQNRILPKVNIEGISREEHLQVQPNPFYRATQIEFLLSLPQTIELAIHNLDGQEIQVLQKGLLPAGKHTVAYETNQLNGIYMVILKTETTILTQKIISLK